MKYQILPFRFARFNEEEYLLSNDVGEYIFLKNDDFHKFVKGELDPTSDLFYDIESKQIATTDNVEDVVKMLATKFRTKKSILEDFTSLHMVVPTLRCNSSCIYCQVKRHESTDHSADMTKKTAKNIVKTIFMSPSIIRKTKCFDFLKRSVYFPKRNVLFFTSPTLFSTTNYR